MAAVTTKCELNYIVCWPS